MRIINDVIRGAVKVDGLPDRVSFSSWRDAILALPELLTIEVPPGAIGVVVGQDTPSEDDRNKVWYRRDKSGAYLGAYGFQNGAWHEIQQTGLQQVYWVYGNSLDVPEGFTVIEPGDAAVPEVVVNKIIGQYVPNGVGGYSYFALRFSGY